ncbi:AraC family transcriptional regulator [Ectopseudomonas hydrolytica]|jgi:AraC family transcriptional regulator|uniref:Transcriptional regulator, AraC family n=1 Tax=Ectopseudomonas mendocina (strain ymp) TaxID=399739 RepID=A4XZN4_ECTM1
MDPVNKALWLIETELDTALDLERLASVSGLSRFTLSRVFAGATGWSVMRYVKARRLSCAAHRLAKGAPDILEVALAVGYGSHEAFTRAFRDHFGITPETLRASGDLNGIELREALRMHATTGYALSAPRFVDAEELLIVGLSERFNVETAQGIAALWQRFGPYIGRIPGQQGSETFGVCCNPEDDGSFEYIAGVLVNRAAEVPAGLTLQRLAAHRYAVFLHEGHISSIHETFNAIFQHWLPTAGVQTAAAPEFERYSEDFDPMAGTGRVEIWVPLRD